MQKKHSIRKLLDGKGYYIVLAVCILAIGCSALIFYRSLRDPVGEEEPVQTLSVPATAQPPAASHAEKTPAASKETAATASVVGSSAASPKEPEAVTVGTVLVCDPVEGDTIAAFSAEALAYNPTMSDWRTHNGVDIGAALGAKVCTVMDGVVTAVYDDDYLGTVVTVEHSDGWSTLYANLTAVPAVSAGDSVRAGQVIGAVGQSAMLEAASQPHLHLEVYRYGALTDPALLLG